MTDIRQISRRWHEAWGTPNIEAAYCEYLFLSEFDHGRDCKVALGGSSLPVRQAGDARKPCLILLHGWPQTSLAWKGVLPKLGKDNCAAAFDLPGVGESENPPPSAEKRIIAETVLTAAEKAGGAGPPLGRGSSKETARRLMIGPIGGDHVG
ncbi:hypothetical protein NKH41_32130 [Mesorhizobium sp. M1169]|uniref:alpha/beta fold hydrolase n=1 Tax=Mesorhizobium sp. M1169 TaxID=2957066 RepID=UPI003339009A